MLGSRGLLRAHAAGVYPLSRDLLDAWAARHVTHERRLGRLRQRLHGRRDQFYYETAHALCRRAQVIVLEGDGTRDRAMDLRPLASGDDTKRADQRHIVAPYRLRTIIGHVAPRYAVPVVMVDNRRTSMTCPECSALTPAGPAILVTCPDGHVYDQRVAACTEALRRWRERPGDGGEPGGARTPQGPGIADNGDGEQGGRQTVPSVSSEALADAVGS